MFNSKAKYINNLFGIITKIIMYPISVFLLISFMLNIFGIWNIIPIDLYIDANNPWMKLLTNTLFFGCIGTAIGFIYLISGIIIKKKCMSIYANECFDIINETKLPDKCPKVLYVYTAHNDLIESRVLQNMRQTYKNFEVWVSDGSDNVGWREKIKKFCNNNNINLYQLGIEGSKNKADNLNQFLSQYQGDYDYLLIGDADEVFNENFVEHAVKMFLSNKIKHLGYISPLNINYRSKGIVPNTLRLVETSAFRWEFYTMNFAQSILPPLGSQSCLISKQKFIECNKSDRFDSGNLEDWYLESNMVETMNYGIMLPTAPCYFEPDANIKAHFDRIMRISDWVIRWWKLRPKEILKNYNERYSEWYKRYFLNLIRPLIIFLSLGITALIIWILTNYWDYAFSNNILFWIQLGLSVFLGLTTLIIYSILISTSNFNFMDFILFPFVFLMWSFSANIKVTIHWFKSLFLGKYSEFGGSGKSRFIKSKSKTIRWWIWFFILTICLASFNSCIFMLTNWTSIKWLIIFFDVYVGITWLGVTSYLILWYINFIPYNSSFSRNNEIEINKNFKI